VVQTTPEAMLNAAEGGGPPLPPPVAHGPAPTKYLQRGQAGGAWPSSRRWRSSTAREISASSRRTSRRRPLTRAIDQAGRLFAGMVVLAGVTALSAMFMVKKPKVYNDRFFNGPWKSGPPPRGPGAFYKPATTYAPLPPRLGGYTSAYGDIVVNSTKPAWAQGEVLLHEQLHQMLTPKLYLLRDVRVTLAMEGYNRSYLLRYLEEALAQSYALVRSRGPGFALEGIKFPVKNGYVTVAKMGQEIAGVVLGPINVGGTANHLVYFLQSHSHGVSGSW
jgi:hypothetical protein